jgi:hypothetical protein
MLDLEKSIAEWRKGMRGRLSEETIDELESHLRDAVAELVQSGLRLERAFERAAKELGSTSGLAREFEKMEQGMWLPIKFAIGVELLAVVAGVIVLILNLDSPGMRFLLWSHVVLVTLGYSTTFLIGALGICYVGQRSFSGFPRVRMRAMARATFAFGWVAAIATIAAVVLGSVWANAAWGRYWGWDIEEVGAVAVILWQLTFVAAHWFVRRNEQVLVLISIFGNVVVAMAWFGSNLLSGTPGTVGWVTLVIAVAVNCALFVAGLAPAGWGRRLKAEEKF